MSTPLSSNQLTHTRAFETDGGLQQPPHCEQIISALFEELHNPMSLWQELRITNMSGADYVFIPDFVYEALGPSYSMMRFMTELSCAFSLDPTRTQLIRTRHMDDAPSFSKVILEWSADSDVHYHSEAIQTESQFHDYVYSLFQASSSATQCDTH